MRYLFLLTVATIALAGCEKRIEKPTSVMPPPVNPPMETQPTTGGGAPAATNSN